MAYAPDERGGVHYEARKLYELYCKFYIETKGLGYLDPKLNPTWASLSMEAKEVWVKLAKQIDYEVSDEDQD